MYDLSQEIEERELIDQGYPVDIDEGTTVRVFKGHTTKVCQEPPTNLSTSAITSASMLLQAMRCITLIKRGGPSNNSIYILHFPPTEEAFLAFREREGFLTSKIVPSRADVLTSDLQSLRQMHFELQERVAFLEGIVNQDTIGK